MSANDQGPQNEPNRTALEEAADNGSIVKLFDEKERYEIVEVELDKTTEIREQLPLLKHRREDVYIMAEK